MKFIAVYLLICAVRTSMPHLTSKVKVRIFLTRLGCTAIGCAIAYGPIYLLSRSGRLINDPATCQEVMGLVIALCAVVGEFVTRRYLRSLDFWPKNRALPWTY